MRTAIVAAIAVARRSQAQQPVPKDLVVTPAWLAAHLDQPNLVILHVGPAEAFDQKHIAGAHFVSESMRSRSSRSAPARVSTLEMPPADQLREGLESLGISDNSTIVVYYASEWFTPSTRLMFTLDYAGLGDRAHYLDGGLEAWMRDGHPVSTERRAPGAGHLSALKTRPLVVDANYVHSHLNAPRVAIVDARAPVFYDGIDAGHDRDGAQRRGHIAGAKSVPFTDDDRRSDNAQESRPARSDLRQGRRAARRHDRRLLPHRTAGDGRCSSPRGCSGIRLLSVRRLVRQIGRATRSTRSRIAGARKAVMSSRRREPQVVLESISHRCSDSGSCCSRRS